jgi:GNAT superfamily N-acetyltransferase
MNIMTQDKKFILRMATPEDDQLIVSFMKKLGKFQKMEDLITVTPKSIKKLLSEKLGNAIFGYYENSLVSFAYFYKKSSAFTGRAGIYIDAFLVDDSMRGKGLGTIIFQFLSKYSVDNDCEFLEWGCLDWNSQAINFYKKQGAYCIDTMRTYRLSPESLLENAELFRNKL